MLNPELLQRGLARVAHADLDIGDVRQPQLQRRQDGAIAGDQADLFQMPDPVLR